ncbi:uncharacterized protein [Erythrolamprus reginae]|uniref:uncharacterized protein n=1 Tax=Erythrolamprus reginae TaxID=121349 RepID=UPI00396CD7A4
MGKFLLTCSIVILFILLQTGELVSARRGYTRRQNIRRSESKRSSNTWNHHVNKLDNSHRSNSRSASPSARDRSQNSFLFEEPRNYQSHLSNLRSSSNRKKPENRPSHLDMIPNALFPPRDSHQKPENHPRSVVKPEIPESFSHQRYNHQDPQLGQNKRKTKRTKSKDKTEGASEFADRIKDLYPLFSSSEGGNSRSHDGNPVDSKPKGDEVKYVVGETVRNAPVVDPESYILGSPIAKMFLHFNDSEEKWWNENRHRFPTPVYHPNSIQPISRERVALANSLGRASGHNPQNNAVSDLHFSFENALFLIHPFAISVITLITPFLIF